MALDPILESLKKQKSSALDALQSSPTAQFSSAAPNPADIARQQSLMRTQAAIDTKQNQILRERWYGKDSDDTVNPPTGQGTMSWVIDKALRPLRGVVGTVDYLTGNTPKGSWSETVLYNMDEAKRTFGDVLRDYNVPGSAPIGFMLDIAFDPVNWATLGTAALIPRTFAGAAIAGAKRGSLSAAGEAFVKGAASNLTDKAMTVKNLSTLALGRKAPQVIAEGAEQAVKPTRFSKIMETVGDTGMRWGDDYNKLIGYDPMTRVRAAGNVPFARKILGADEVSDFRMGIGDLIRLSAEKTPWVGKYFEHFDYNNAEWTRLARIKDALIKATGGEESMNKAATAAIKAQNEGRSFDDVAGELYEQGAKQQLEQIPTATRDIDWDASSRVLNAGERQSMDEALSRLANENPELGLVDPIKQTDEVEDILREAADTVDIMKDPQKYITSDRWENAIRIAEDAIKDTGKSVTLKDIEEIVKRGELGATGVKWFDDLKAGIRNTKRQTKMGQVVQTTMAKTLDALEAYTALFKRAKVGGSPTAWTNAIIGNPVMAWMAGINILDPLYMRRVKESFDVVRGKRGSDLFLSELLDNQESIAQLAANPTLFARTTGISYNQLRAKMFLEDLIRTGEKTGRGKMTVEQLAKDLNVEIGKVSQALSDLGRLRPGTASQLQTEVSRVPGVRLTRPSQMVQDLVDAGGTVEKNALPVTMGAQEMFDSSVANKLFQGWREGAERGEAVSTVLNTAFNRFSEAYEGIDQTYKLGTIMYTMMDGLSEAELRLVSRSIKLDPENLTKFKSGGRTRYKLDMVKSLELANEIYLNYAAMPAAIRVLRSLPLLGSPFASFMYGMTLKSGKTLAYNPAVFNKVANALHDFGGGQTPLEKGVLSDPRYAYLNDPAMLKLPFGGSGFMQQYGLYMNVANMLPYYSLNMFTPSERRYGELWPDRIVKAIDKSPIMKDPVGSAIFDYLIQPYVIGMATGSKDLINRPRGSFGQYLYPSDAGALSKAGYAARQLVDPVLPGFLAFGGALQGMGDISNIPGTDTQSTELAPIYRWRTLANALHGKTAAGVQTKESPASKFSRSIFATLGLPVQTPVPMTYLPDDLEQQVENSGQ